MSKTSEHPSIRTNAALVALAEAVAAGKGVSVPLHREEGFIILTPGNVDVKYTKAQAAEMLAGCINQARTSSLKYAKDLPAQAKSALAIVYTIASGPNKGLKVGALAHALNSTTGFRTDAGKAIRAARDAAKIAETGGWIHTPSGIVGPSKRKTAKAAIRADHGNDWWKGDNADDLRSQYRAETVQVAEQVEVEAVAETAAVTTGTVTKAVLQDRCKSLCLPVTGTKAELQARIDAVPLAGQMGWHS